MQQPSSSGNGDKNKRKSPGSDNNSNNGDDSSPSHKDRRQSSDLENGSHSRMVSRDGEENDPDSGDSDNTPQRSNPVLMSLL